MNVRVAVSVGVEVAVGVAVIVEVAVGTEGVRVAVGAKGVGVAVATTGSLMLVFIEQADANTISEIKTETLKIVFFISNPFQLTAGICFKFNTVRNSVD